MKRHVFALDQRPTGERFRQKFLKFTPFPYERHDGQGFLREQEIDTEFVKAGMAMAAMVVWPARMTQRKVPKPATRGSRVDVQERDFAPAPLAFLPNLALLLSRGREPEETSALDGG